MTRTTTLTALLALTLALPAQAEFQLSDRYTDTDGDLIADIPEDESQWLDPDTLIFAYTPVEDPAVYADVWQGFLDHMAEVTGKKVQFFPVQSNAAQIEAMRAGRLHVAGFNTGSNPIAVACAGFRSFAMMAAEDGSFGYEMEIITYPGSGIEEVEDIRGKELTFTAETSNSGFKAPSALLKGEFDMIAGEDFDTSFSGAHDNSVLGVANKDYIAAAGRQLGQEPDDRPRRGLRGSARGRLPVADLPDDRLRHGPQPAPRSAGEGPEAFFSFDWEGTALAEEFGRNGEDQFIEITFKDDWAVIRTIDAANGVTYDCN